MKIHGFKNVKLVCKNDVCSLFVAEQEINGSPNIFRFVSKQGSSVDPVGVHFSTQEAINNSAFEYATDLWGYTPEEVDPFFPRNTTITLTVSQKVAINTAIQVLSQSESDHAEQANFYLKQISKTFK